MRKKPIFFSKFHDFMKKIYFSLIFIFSFIAFQNNTFAQNAGVGEYSLKGTDGLYFYKNGLLAIQNGVSPMQVVYLSLDKKLPKITQRKVLENNNPALNEPTLGV